MRAMPDSPTIRAGLLLAAALVAPTASRAADPRPFEDAALHAVQFVDANEGWAAGDDGVVWHTIDGGQNWERQPTGVRASLRSLHFVNPYVGWAAGREELPNGAGSAGVLLYTRDGGLKWRRVLINALPGLNVVRFIDGQTGYVAGDGSDACPSGVFLTTDAGRTWQPVAGRRCAAWLAADFNPEAGALVGAWNQAAAVQRDQIGVSQNDSLGARNLRGLRLWGKRGIAVGQGGLVLGTEDGGFHWNFADVGLAPGVAASWDFHAVGAAGRHVWVVGRPGSAVLHSPDGGKSWEVRRTNQPLPLNGVYFHDERRGWAVGELGSVLATDDGGRTWKVQHRGGNQSAALLVCARSAGLPADALAILGAEEGYLAAAVRVTCADPATAAPARCGEGPRFAAAVRQAGGAAGEQLWQFPVSSHVARAGRDQLLQSWDKLHGDRAAEQLLRELVLAVRIWRPAVVITDSPDRTASPYPAEAVVAEATREAFLRAADPDAFPEQINTLGLEPWKAAKAYARWEGDPPGQVAYDLTETAPHLGATYREFAAGPAALLAEHSETPPARRGYRLLADRLTGAAAHRGLMEGIDLPAGGLARRPEAKDSGATPDELKAARQRATFLALAEAPAAGLTDPNRLLAQIGPMLEGMPDDRAAPAAFAAAAHYARTGQWALAREAFLLVADRYPAHPLAADAYRWLLRHNASSEARRRHELGQFLVVEQRRYGQPRAGEDGKPETIDPGEGKVKGLPKLPALETKATRELLLRSDSRLSPRDGTRQWYQGALDVGPKLAAFGPLLADDPSVQFPLQAARRTLGDYDGARHWYAKFAARQPDGPWKSAALAELWLAERRGAPPKPVAACRFAAERPYLDGKLDDACWQGVAPLDLTSASGSMPGEYKTQVRMAYDREFLYLAVRCFHPSGRQEAPATSRRHDADLRGHDRVSILLDLDRDYATCFHLQVDQRGCVWDDCWGDKTWDPNWFVAVQSEPTVWQLEAAIPLVALTGDTVTPGKAWAFNVIRAIPGAGVQAFSLPAEAPEEALRPEGLGLLMFQPDGRQTAAAAPTTMPKAH